MTIRRHFLKTFAAGSGLVGFRRLVVWPAIGLIWLIILPAVLHFDLISDYVARMKRAGINPSAVYYTEHPASRDWERSLQDKLARHPKLFWNLPWMK